MGDDDLVALLDNPEQGGRRLAHTPDLLLWGIAKGVATKGDDDAVGLAIGF